MNRFLLTISIAIPLKGCGLWPLLELLKVLESSSSDYVFYSRGMNGFEVRAHLLYLFYFSGTSVHTTS